MTYRVFCQEDKVVIFILLGVKIVRIQTISAQINLVTKDNLKVRIIFLNFLIAFLNQKSNWPDRKAPAQR